MAAETWFITGARAASAASGPKPRSSAATGSRRPPAHWRTLTTRQRFGDAVLPMALDVTDTGQVQQAVARRTRTSAGWTSSSITPATRWSAPSRKRARPRSARCSTRTFSARSRHAGSAAPAAATGQRAHRRRLQRPWDRRCRSSASTAPRNGRRGDPRKPGARGQGVRHQGDPDRARRLRHRFRQPPSRKMAAGIDTYADLRASVFGGLPRRARRPAGDGRRGSQRGRDEPPCGSCSATCSRWRGPPTPTGSPPGRRGKRSRTPPRATPAWETVAQIERFVTTEHGQPLFTTEGEVSCVRS